MVRTNIVYTNKEGKKQQKLLQFPQVPEIGSLVQLYDREGKEETVTVKVIRTYYTFLSGDFHRVEIIAEKL
jgi:hypothetical protein